MKWLLLIGLIFLIANRRHLVGDLVNTAKKLPKDYRDAKKKAEDPVGAAKPVAPKVEPKPTQPPDVTNAKKPGDPST